MAGPHPPGSEREPVERPSIDLQFVGHATVRLDIGGVRVLTDPFLRDRLGPLERHGPMPDPDDLGAIDVVVISHGHPDHFDRASLAVLRDRPVVVVPRGLGASAARWVAGDVLEMTVGDRVDVGGLIDHGGASPPLDLAGCAARGTDRISPRRRGHGLFRRGHRAAAGHRRARGNRGCRPAPGLDLGPAPRAGSPGPTICCGGGGRMPAGGGCTDPLGHALPTAAPSPVARTPGRTGRPLRRPCPPSRSGCGRPGPPPRRVHDHPPGGRLIAVPPHRK